MGDAGAFGGHVGLEHAAGDDAVVGVVYQARADAAALAVDTISKTPGYKPYQEIAVVQGRNGNFIATQGLGDAALNVAVPSAQQGDFERVATQMAAKPQQDQQLALAQPTEQQECKPMRV